MTQREVVTGCCTAGAVPRRERSDADRQAVTAADSRHTTALSANHTRDGTPTLQAGEVGVLRFGLQEVREASVSVAETTALDTHTHTHRRRLIY